MFLIKERKKSLKVRIYNQIHIIVLFQSHLGQYFWLWNSEYQVKIVKKEVLKNKYIFNTDRISCLQILISK